MYKTIRAKIIDLYTTFHGSETILIARFNVVMGSLYAGLQLLDPTQLPIDVKYITAWVVGNGVLTEYLRRRNAEYDDDGTLK